MNSWEEILILFVSDLIPDINKSLFMSLLDGASAYKDRTMRRLISIFSMTMSGSGQGRKAR